MTKQIKLFSKPTIVVAYVLAVVLLAVVIFSGYPQYWVATLRCGQQPVAVRSWGFGGSAVYDLPSSSVYKVRYGNKYYCNESEVKIDGIRQNPLTPENVLQ